MEFSLIEEKFTEFSEIGESQRSLKYDMRLI